MSEGNTPESTRAAATCPQCKEPGIVMEMWTHGMVRTPNFGEARYEKECVFYVDDDCLQMVRWVHGPIVATYVPAHWKPVEQTTSIGGEVE